MSRVAGLLEKQDQPIWDTLDVANASVGVQFFTVPIGGAKTLSLTNLVLPGSLPSPEGFECRGVSLDFPQAITAADIRIILATAVLELFINTKIMLELPLQQIGPAGGVWVGSEIDDSGAVATTDESVVLQGFPAVGNFFALPIPIIIETKENFRGDVTFRTAIAGLAATRAMSLMLHGVKTRSVQ